MRAIEDGRLKSIAGPARPPTGLGSVVPEPIVPAGNRRGGGIVRVIVAVLLLGVCGWGAAGAVMQLGAQPARAADCTALTLDRRTGVTSAGPCIGPGPALPTTLTALLPDGLPMEVAATR